MSKREDLTKTISEQYVVFSLEEEKYGLDISVVKEIVRWNKITKLPQMDEELCGVIKLREQVIPVISLRKSFGLPELEDHQDAKIMILEVQDKVVGVIVDNVEEVVSVPDSAIQTSPGTVTHNNEIISGIAKLENYLLILIDANIMLA